MQTLSVEQMNDAERLCYVLSTLFAADVSNGGFWQFYYNIEATEYDEIVEGLETVGAQKALDSLLAARALLSDGGRGTLDEARNTELPAPSVFKEVDRQFASVENDLFDRIHAYAASRGLLGSAAN